MDSQTMLNPLNTIMPFLTILYKLWKTRLWKNWSNCPVVVICDSQTFRELPISTLEGADCSLTHLQFCRPCCTWWTLSWQPWCFLVPQNGTLLFLISSPSHILMVGHSVFLFVNIRAILRCTENFQQQQNKVTSSGVWPDESSVD